MMGRMMAKCIYCGASNTRTSDGSMYPNECACAYPNPTPFPSPFRQGLSIPRSYNSDDDVSTWEDEGGR